MSKGDYCIKFPSENLYGIEELVQFIKQYQGGNMDEELVEELDRMLETLRSLKLPASDLCVSLDGDTDAVIRHRRSSKVARPTVSPLFAKMLYLADLDAAEHRRRRRTAVPGCEEGSGTCL